LEVRRPLRRSAGVFERSWDRCAALWHTSRVAEATAPLCGRLGAVFSQQWFFNNYKALCLCYSHKIRYIIISHALWNSLSIYIRSSGLQMVLEYNRRRTWTRPLRTELEGREHTSNTPLHLLQHPNGIQEKEGFWFVDGRNQVKRYDTARRWGSTQLGGSTNSQTMQMGSKVGKDRVSILFVW